MEKRYQVFLSSTYQDLSEERLEVIKALLELDCFPSGMEYFPAASEESWSYITTLIEQCDYYVVVVGGRYGSLTPEGISFTQKEYLYATSKGIPTIAFIHASPDDIPAKKTESSPEGKKKLAEFIALLEKNLCKKWSSSHELGAVVSRSLTQLIKRHPRTGWIPASEANDPRTAHELLVLTQKNRELEEELRRVRGRAALDTSDLSDGDDLADFSINYSISHKVAHANGWIGDEVVSRVSGTIKVTWNDLFRAIASRIAPVANDQGIRSGINALFAERAKSPKNILKKGQWISAVTIADESYNVLKIQFTALGLVMVAKEKKEDGGHGHMLWRLTEKGEARMFQELAIKKKPAKS